MAKMQVMAAIAMVLVALLATMTNVEAGKGWNDNGWNGNGWYGNEFNLTALVLEGKTFNITNVLPISPTICPGSDNTVTFSPSSSNPLVGTATVVGEFDGCGIYICNGNNYAFPPGTLTDYYIYGNFIHFQIEVNVVPSACTLGIQQGQIYAFGLQQGFYVSILTPV